MHAATLVTAGAILLLKLAASSFAASSLIFLIGALTSLLCGCAACFEGDLKATIAYSTAGQLGFVFMLLGCSEHEAAFLHLANHAVFKS